MGSRCKGLFWSSYEFLGIRRPEGREAVLIKAVTKNRTEAEAVADGHFIAA